MPALSRWIDGTLAVRLEQAGQRLLAADRPFVLMTSRNRVMLRVELAEPEPATLDQAIGLFETAVSRVPNAIEGLAETSSAWPSTAASAWHSQLPGWLTSGVADGSMSAQVSVGTEMITTRSTRGGATVPLPGL